LFSNITNIIKVNNIYTDIDFKMLVENL
jgi:hypothetical protein